MLTYVCLWNRWLAFCNANPARFSYTFIQRWETVFSIDPLNQQNRNIGFGLRSEMNRNLVNGYTMYDSCQFVVRLVQSWPQDVLTLNHWQDRMVWNMKSFDLLIYDVFRNLYYRHKLSQLHIRWSKGYLCSCILAICFEILIGYARFYYET